MSGFFSKLFKRRPNDGGGLCLQRSATALDSDSSSDEDEAQAGPASAPEARELYSRRTEPQHILRMDPPMRRAGGEIRRSQTYSGRSDTTRMQASARISSSSCDSCSPDDQLRMQYGKVKQCHRGKVALILEGTDRKTKRPVIIKAFSKMGMSSTLREKMEREQTVLKAAAGCTGVVRLLNSVEDVMNNYLVLESVPGETLIEMISHSGGRLQESRCVVEVVFPLLQALASLHELGIVHRDIKPEHIMCTCGSVKLLDFCHSAQQRQQCLNYRVGQLEYMAPEVLNKPSADEIFHQVLFKGMAENELPQYDEKADVWSAGAVIFEALTGQQPFLAEDAHEMSGMHAALATQVGSDGLPTRLDHPRLSSLARHFLAAALEVDPARRPSAEQLLQHSWVTKYTNGQCSQWLMQPSPTTSSHASSTTSSYNTGHPNPSPPVKLSIDLLMANPQANAIVH